MIGCGEKYCSSFKHYLASGLAPPSASEAPPPPHQSPPWAGLDFQDRDDLGGE